MNDKLTVRVIDERKFVNVSEEWFVRVDRMLRVWEASEMRPDHPAILQAKADDNRDNAGERFPNLTWCTEPHNYKGYLVDQPRWEDEDGDEVVFTPHGYRKRADVE